jgi:excisionase family DNA binding protein
LCAYSRTTSNNVEVVPLRTLQTNTGKKAVAPLHPPKARRINDACRAIGVSRTTIYKLAGEGKIKLVHVLGRTLVPESEIERLAPEGVE